MKPPPEVSISNARPIPPRSHWRLFALIGVAAGFAVAWVGLRFAARSSHDEPARAPVKALAPVVRIPQNLPTTRVPAASQSAPGQSPPSVRSTTPITPP